MTDLESRFHAEWLGLVQPVEGLVVSVPVLTDAQCMRRQPLARQQRLADLAPAGRITDLPAFLAELLDWTPDLFDASPSLPDDLSLYVPEGHQTLRPTLALRHLAAPDAPASTTDDSTPASRAGAAYVALLWDLPAGLPLDAPETTTGTWEYPPSAKFDRLLRACRVPIGVLTNREVVRLVYAPHGESSGHLTFRVDDMASVAGRTIFDAFVMLLSAERLFGVAPEHQLPALLRDSRTRQANVTNELAEQMLDALHVLLAGFVAAAERDGSSHLDDALSRDDDTLYKGLLTVLLRLVFVLYAEDRALLPIEHPHYAENLSVLGLFAQLQRDHGEWPDSMARRFGAWPRLVALFRAVFLGLSHGDLVMPARRGELFDPHRFAFLEGWGPAGTAPIVDPLEMGAVRVPTVDDETVFRVLERLLVFQGQRLSYRALDVEQIGAVYEALMGYHVVRLAGPSVCLKGARVWVTAGEVLAQSPAQRGAWVAESAALPKSAGAKLAEALRGVASESEVLAALEPWRVKASATARTGQLVIQPGTERRRTALITHRRRSPRPLSEERSNRCSRRWARRRRRRGCSTSRSAIPRWGAGPSSSRRVASSPIRSSRRGRVSRDGERDHPPHPPPHRRDVDPHRRHRPRDRRRTPAPQRPQHHPGVPAPRRHPPTRGRPPSGRDCAHERPDPRNTSPSSEAGRGAPGAAGTRRFSSEARS